MLLRFLALSVFLPSAFAQCTLNGVSLTLGNPNTITYTSATGAGCGALASGITSANPIPAGAIVTGADGARGVQGSTASIDASGNGGFPGSVQAGQGSGFTGSLEATAKTSGNTAGFTVLDTLESSLLYILPSGPGTGLFLQDSGVATCPTNALGAPAVCHQTQWANPGTSGGGSGALILLEEHAASAGAAINFTTRNVAGQSGPTIQADFDIYQIEVVNLAPSANGAQILFRVSTNGGTSYDSGSNYAWGGFRYCAGGTAVVGANSATSIGLGGTGNDYANTASLGGMSGHVKLYSPASGSFQLRTDGQIGYPTAASCTQVMDINTGTYLSTTAINSFQISTSAGVLNAGNVRCYGVTR